MPVVQNYLLSYEACNIIPVDSYLVYALILMSTMSNTPYDNGVQLSSSFKTYGSLMSTHDINAWLDNVRSAENEIFENKDPINFEQENVSDCENQGVKLALISPSSQKLQLHENKENIPHSPTSTRMTTEQSPHLKSNNPYSLESPQSVIGCDSRPLIEVPTTPVVVRKTRPPSRIPTSKGKRRSSSDKEEICFTSPPWRKKSNCTSSRAAKNSQTTRREYTVENTDYRTPQKYTPKTEENAEVRELSPLVTPFRKGQEPRRVRRRSYYDEDILTETKVKME